MTPVKFGISSTSDPPTSIRPARVHVYQDGSVHLDHGGTEMGQGLLPGGSAGRRPKNSRIGLERVHVAATSTDEVPNTSATAASSGADPERDGHVAERGAWRSSVAADALCRRGLERI